MRGHNEGKNWTRSHVRELYDLYVEKAQRNIPKLAAYFGRTEYAIRCKLHDLHLITEEEKNMYPEAPMAVPPAPNPNIPSPVAPKPYPILQTVTYIYGQPLQDMSVADCIAVLKTLNADIEQHDPLAKQGSKKMFAMVIEAREAIKLVMEQLDA